jgi:ribosomal protein S18 acetylase RimI-like enzyme
MIYEYQSDDYKEVINCILELQTTESILESTRITNKVIAELYFKEVQAKLSINSGKIFVSKKDNTITGLVIISIEENEIYEKPGRHLMILDIVVKYEFRHLGIGKKLMGKAESFAAENSINEIRLYALMKNKVALDFYRNSGYKDFGVALTKNLNV